MESMTRTKVLIFKWCCGAGKVFEKITQSLKMILNGIECFYNFDCVVQALK